MRYLGYPLMLTVMGLFAAGVLALVGLVSSAGKSADEPRDASLALNFGGPETVLFCWSQSDRPQVTSYDLQVVRWNFGRTRTEIVHGVTSGDCGPAVGAAHVFNEDNLYHVDLRACRSDRCSDWVEASSDEAYWFQIPCRALEVNGCFFPRSSDDGASSRAE